MNQGMKENEDYIVMGRVALDYRAQYNNAT